MSLGRVGSNQDFRINTVYSYTGDGSVASRHKAEEASLIPPTLLSIGGFPLSAVRMKLAVLCLRKYLIQIRSTEYIYATVSPIGTVVGISYSGS